MNWYKANISLAGGREETIVMRTLGVDENAALGLLHRWLAYINAQTEDGCTGLLPGELDRVMRFAGARVTGVTEKGYTCNQRSGTGVTGNVFDALQACGWVELNERGEVCAADFDRYNSESVRKRAKTALKVAKHRAKKKAAAAAEAAKAAENSVTEKGYTRNRNVTPDKIREDIKENSSSELKENRADDSAQGLVDAAMAPEPDDGTPAREAPRPADADEVADYLNTLPTLRLTPGQRLEAARAFFDEMEAVGWVSKHGQVVWRWKAYARRWACAWAENSHGAAYRGGQAAARPSRNTGTINDRDHSEYDDI